MHVYSSVFLFYYRYIDEEDLLKFLKSEEVHTIFPLFEGAVETGRITKSSFRNWVVSFRIIILTYIKLTLFPMYNIYQHVFACPAGSFVYLVKTTIALNYDLLLY